MPIGFGADTKDFRYDGQPPPEPPVFVYAGTHSEWHGAGIFVEAMPQVLQQHPGARLEYYGNGEEREAMQARARELGIAESVEFYAPIPPAALSPILAAATASVASLAPVPANEYALATKVYSSLAAGCPVIFAGPGPTVEFLNDAGHPARRRRRRLRHRRGRRSDDRRGRRTPATDCPRRAGAWSAGQFSLDAIAQRVVDESLAIIRT